MFPRVRLQSWASSPLKSSRTYGRGLLSANHRRGRHLRGRHLLAVNWTLQTRIHSRLYLHAGTQWFRIRSSPHNHLGQVPALFGETNVGSGTSTIIHDIFIKLPQTKPLTFAVGISGIVLLTIMQLAGKRWEKRF